MAQPNHLRAAFENVALALRCDENRGIGISFADVDHRFHTLVEAREHLRELGAAEAYRQALVELAAAAIQVAAVIEDSPPWGSSISPPEAAVIRGKCPGISRSPPKSRRFLQRLQNFP